MAGAPDQRESLRLHEALIEQDALLAHRQGPWWDSFYQDRAKPVPFFVPWPDESLVEWVNDGPLTTGRALDLGCGNGRNAVFLAQAGFAVDGVDYSREAIDWASQRSAQAGVDIRLHRASVFDLALGDGAFDLVCDSGCFHHMPPHRRTHYVDRVVAALKPGGWLAMSCFRPEGGSGLTDEQVYERRTLGGGLGYTEARLREIWSGALQIRQLRQMRQPAADSGLFGLPTLWVMLAQKP